MTYRYLGKTYCGLKEGQLRCDIQWNDEVIETMPRWAQLLPRPAANEAEGQRVLIGWTQRRKIVLRPCLRPEGHDLGHLSDTRYGRLTWWMDNDEEEPS